MLLNNFSKKRIMFLKYITTIIYLLLLIIDYTFKNIDVLLAIFLIILNVIILIQVRKNHYLLIVFAFIFYSNYSICMANYLSYFNGDFFTSWTPSYESSLALKIITLFSMILFLFLPANINSKNKIKPLIYTNRSNSYISIICWLFLFVIFFIGYSSSAEFGGRGQVSSSYEYSIILFIIGIYYSGKNKSIYYMYFLMLVLFILQDVLSGNRVVAIQLLICLYLSFLIYKFKTKTLIIISLLGVVFLTMVGGMRGNMNLVSLEDMKNSINYLWNSKLVFDTSYAAYFTSLTFIRVKNLISIKEQLYLLKSFILYIFFGSKINDAILPNYTRKYFTHYYGGVYPIYGYFYLGIFGVIMFSFYCVFFIKLFCKLDNDSSGFFRCICILIVCSVPRWYLYSPFQLSRNLLIFSFCYLIAYLFHKLCMRKFIKPFI